MINNAMASILVRRHSSAQPWTYSMLDRQQRELASEVKNGKSGTLILSELAPVITQGRRTPCGDILYRPGDLERLGVDLYPTDRGGLATYHGPGQWVLFPVERLDVLSGDSRGVRQAVESLLEIARSVGELYHSHVEIRSGDQMGVWTRRGKFASVGIHIDQGVLLHGLSVNGFRTPQSFMGLRPCGLDTPMDYLLPDTNFSKANSERTLEANPREYLKESPVEYLGEYPGKYEDEFIQLGNRLIEKTLQKFWNQGLTGRSENTITSQQSRT
jgi:lipoate-protein ligase B